MPIKGLIKYKVKSAVMPIKLLNKVKRNGFRLLIAKINIVRDKKIIKT